MALTDILQNLGKKTLIATVLVSSFMNLDYSEARNRRRTYSHHQNQQYSQSPAQSPKPSKLEEKTTPQEKPVHSFEELQNIIGPYRWSRLSNLAKDYLEFNWKTNPTTSNEIYNAFYKKGPEYEDIKPFIGKRLGNIPESQQRKYFNSPAEGTELNRKWLFYNILVRLPKEYDKMPEQTRRQIDNLNVQQYLDSLDKAQREKFLNFFPAIPDFENPKTRNPDKIWASVLKSIGAMK
ncbi:hypothetical protein J4218_04635 [Candidatus Pacearchaeota archaeon]|nr:hypothetical protein [Candidatus Pacearchaeota archaeon]